MHLGETIYRLRTEKGMSQSDLADALSVSRQSVSKWETDSATPDLEKLLKLSQLFDISLDELVKGEPQLTDACASAFHSQTEPQVIYVERTESSVPKRKIIGAALFGLAILTMLLCTILGGLLEGILFSLPLWICGSICFLFHKRIGLWCSWAVFFLVDLVLHFTTGSASGNLFALLRGVLQGYLSNPITLWVSLVMVLLLALLLFGTIHSYRDKVLEPDARITHKLIGMVLVIVLLYAIPYGFSIVLRPYVLSGQSTYLISRVFQVIGIVAHWCRVPVLCRLFIDLFAVCRYRRRKISDSAL